MPRPSASLTFLSPQVRTLLHSVCLSDTRPDADQARARSEEVKGPPTTCDVFLFLLRSFFTLFTIFWCVLPFSNHFCVAFAVAVRDMSARTAVIVRDLSLGIDGLRAITTVEFEQVRFLSLFRRR